MGHNYGMDVKLDPFSKMRLAIKATPATRSSDFDLDPAFLAKLPNNRVLKPASVLIPMIERRAGIQVILTRRSGSMAHHPGQVAFPGGKVDPMDASSKDTALREAEEEIGLPRHNVEIIGKTGTHETVTQFCVTPYLGIVHTDFRPVAEPREVAEIFEVPLDFLMQPDNFKIHSRPWLGKNRSYLAVPYGPHFIWGATARIIKNLADRLQLL